MIKTIKKRKTIQFSYMVETKDGEVILDVSAKNVPSALVNCDLTFHDSFWNVVYSTKLLVLGPYKTKVLEETVCDYLEEHSEELLKKYYEVLGEKCNRGGK